MITFTRGSGANSNTIEIDFGSEVHYVSPESPVRGKNGTTVVYIGNNLNLGNQGAYFKLRTTDINGRPADDAAFVAEWLRDTYFYGLSGGASGGEFPADYANSGNQATMITELQDIESELVTMNTTMGKLGSSQVTEAYDHRSFVYLGNGNLDYISFKTGGIAGSQVARLTYTYDGDDNLTEITKT